MRTRVNQFVIEILLVIVITAIVAFMCINLAELINMFSAAIGDTLIRFQLDF